MLPSMPLVKIQLQNKNVFYNQNLKKNYFFRELFFSILSQFDGKAVPIWKKGCPNLEKRIPQFGKKVVPISFLKQFRRKKFSEIIFQN